MQGELYFGLLWCYCVQIGPETNALIDSLLVCCFDLVTESCILVSGKLGCLTLELLISSGLLAQFYIQALGLDVFLDL
jgi:hypothetical protein